MPSLADPDLAGLASLAQRPGRELRPLLLTLHARAFAAAAIRDRRAIATFEALACGLIPLVPAETLGEVAVLLATVPDAPDSVIALLDHHLFPPESADVGTDEIGIERGSIAGLVARDRADIDLSLAANPSLRLDGHILATLVERAKGSDELARRLLARPELSTFDRACLYRVGNAATRDAIRDDLGIRLAVAARPPRPISVARRTRLMKLARQGDGAALLREIAAALKLDPAPIWRLAVPEEAEFVALAFAALDVPQEECGRIFLTAEPALARSVTSVFRLMRVRRTTPAYVAAYLVGAGPAFRKEASKRGTARAKAVAKAQAKSIADAKSAADARNTADAKSAAEAGSAAQAKSAAGAAKPKTRRARRDPVSAAPARSRVASARPGHRSRSTKDRDRT